MNAQTHSIGTGSRGGEALVRGQIDALASGQMNAATFLRVTIDRLRDDPDENWEVLSLLDQAFRLGKISNEAFRGIKNGLAEFVLRPRTHDQPTGPISSSPAAMPPPFTPVPEAFKTMPTPAPAAPAPEAPRTAPRSPLAAAPEAPRPQTFAPEPVRAVRPAPAPLAPEPEALQPAPAPGARVARGPLPAAHTFTGSQPSQAVTQPTGTQAQNAAPPTLRETPRTPAVPAPAAAPPPRAARVARQAPPPAAIEELAATAPEDRDIAPGDVLRGRYRIVNFIGQGGRGLVYEATDPYRLESQSFGQRIAIKVLHRNLAQRQDAVLELRREFQLLQSLSHPNIVRVHEFDRDGTLSFFTMELLNGVLLSRLAHAYRQRPIKRTDALSILRDVGAAVAFAHSRNVVHGDINPQNIFVTYDGEIRVLDFGAARKTAQLSMAPGEELVHGSFATAGYASVQVMQGEPAQIEDDIFSMGCVAYLLFAGRHPFNEVSSLEAQAARMRPRRPRGMKDATWRALKQALQYDRRKRPNDLREWLARLDLSQAAGHLPSVNELLEERGGSSRGLPWGALAAGLLILLGGAYYYAVRQEILPRPSFLDDDQPPRMARQPAADPAEELPQPVTALPSRPAAASPSRPASNTTRTSPGAANSPSARNVTPAASSAAPRERDASAGTTAGNARAAIASIAGATRGLTESATVNPASPSAAGRSASLPASRPDSAALPPAGADATASPPAGTALRSGSVRLELAADTVDVTADDAAARVVVHRRGASTRGDATFSWWTESGTAKPNADFQAVAPHVDHIPDGSASVTLSVPLLQTLRAQPRSFYLVIDQTEGGATVSGRTLTMVTMPSTSE